MYSGIWGYSSDNFVVILILLLLLPTKVEHENTTQMSIFGIVLFLLIGGMAFWMLLFLLGFIVPYWIHLGVMQQLRPKKVFEKDEEEVH